ncbi:hypothetical protein [Halostella pelagica]|uniref:hypothetical protein n=1 Tax=Halostella pelagica TaxID=2583824 RepID=UPI001081100B|nr:hypothetical protein [Halostella pelagica]
MRRKTLVALALLVLALVVAPAAATAGGSAGTPVQSNESNDSVAPGERLAGVVGVQAAEIDGEMEERTFQLRVSGAGSNTARAAVVTGRITDIETRLEELEERRSELRKARANGSITEGEYRARTAQIVAEARTVERMANASENARTDDTIDVLDQNGGDAVQSLRTRAKDLSGGEAADMARSIAGENAGKPIAADHGFSATNGSDSRSTDAANGSNGRDADGTNDSDPEAVNVTGSVETAGGDHVTDATNSSEQRVVDAKNTAEERADGAANDSDRGSSVDVNGDAEAASSNGDAAATTTAGAIENVTRSGSTDGEPSEDDSAAES